MMKPGRMMALLGLSLVALVAFGNVAASQVWQPQAQEALQVNRVYAYRDWQSTGVQLHSGDRYTIRAEGSWLYSPYAGPNGPQGHRRFWSPDFYPVPRVGGGALIGRVGEGGQPFYVGKQVSDLAQQDGLLYLRINDDRLGDNEGSVSIEVTVSAPDK